LYATLYNETIGEAVFDVFWEESANFNDRLLQLDDFVDATYAGWTRASANVAPEIITRNIEKVVQRKALFQQLPIHRRQQTHV
jgi:phosphoglycerate dehydrogenase-like enzyme